MRRPLAAGEVAPGGAARRLQQGSRCHVPERDALLGGDGQRGSIRREEARDDEGRGSGDRIAQSRPALDVVQRDRLVVRRGQQQGAVPAELQ